MFSTTAMQHLKVAGMVPKERLTSDLFKEKMQKSWLVNVKDPGIHAGNLLRIEKNDYSDVIGKIDMIHEIANDIVRPAIYYCFMF